MNKKIKKASRLTDLQAQEVSIVARGANKKRFLVVKEAETEDKIFEVLDTPLKDEDQNLTEILKGMDVEGQVVLKTAYRLLTGFKNKLSPESLIKLTKQVGIELPLQKEPPPKDEPLGKNQGEAITKLIGKRKIGVKLLSKTAGVEESVMKHVLEGGPPIQDPEAIESLAELLGTETEKLTFKKEGGKPVHKSGSVFKEDGSLNQDAIPEDSREIVNVIFKQQQETARELAKIKKENKHKDAVVKAATFKHIAGEKPEDLANTLMEAKENLSAEAYSELEATLQKADQQLEESDLFKETGRSGENNDNNSVNDNVGPTTAKLLKKAQALVEKSENKVDLATAINKVLKDDKSLYAEYKKENAVRI